MKKIIFLVALSLSSLNFQSQILTPQPSPKCVFNQMVGLTDVEVEYSRPGLKGRNIFGDLVPFGKVWRAGANEATQIETDADLLVEGKKLSAGKYTIYTIPNENQWQLIFNSQVGQWGIERSGETTRNPEKDVLVVPVKPLSANTPQESLVYTITENGISLLWEALVIPINIK